jgi:hypothetical protein
MMSRVLNYAGAKVCMSQLAVPAPAKVEQFAMLLVGLVFQY